MSLLTRKRNGYLQGDGKVTNINNQRQAGMGSGGWGGRRKDAKRGREAGLEEGWRTRARRGHGGGSAWSPEVAAGFPSGALPLLG